MLQRFSTYFYLRPKLVLWLMLGPPMLYMLVVYLGSLFNLLVFSFYYLEQFTGQIVQEFTLQTYTRVLEPANLEILSRTTVMEISVIV